MKIGETRVVVKPAMVVLVAAVLIGAGTSVVLLRDRSAEVPEYGFVNPGTWRFETRGGAKALAFLGGGDAGGKPEATLDAGKGFRVRVDNVGAAADAVYLRNALNLDLNPSRAPLRVTFEARSASAAERGRPFPLTFTVRDSATLLWSQRVPVGPSWEKYERPMTLREGSLFHVIMALHLGEAAGDVEIRNLRVVDAG